MDEEMHSAQKFFFWHNGVLIDFFYFNELNKNYIYKWKKKWWRGKLNLHDPQLQERTWLARPLWSKALISFLLLQGYGFPVSQLFDMLLEMREQYGEILLKKWNITFRYSNVRVANWWEFPRVYLHAFLYIQRGTMHVALTFPFSVIRVQWVFRPLNILARVGLWETSSSWFWSFTTSQREEVF